MKNDSWLKIVGFPNYEMNEQTLAVRSYKSGKPKELKGYMRALSKIIVLHKANKRYRFSEKRLLYSIQNNIDPTTIPADLYTYSLECGKVVLISKTEYLKTITANIKKRRVGKSKEDILANCEQVKYTVDSIAHYHQTGNMSNIVEQVYSYKDSIIYYAIKGEYAYSKQGAIDLFDAVVDIVISRIVEGKVICMLLPYMKSIVRGVAAEKLKHRTVEYKDSIRYQSAAY